MKQWIRLQMGTLYLTLLRLRNIVLAYWISPREWIARHSRAWWILKTAVLFLVTLMVGLLLFFGPVRQFWITYQESLQLESRIQDLDRELEGYDPYAPMIQKAQYKADRFLKEGWMIHPRWHLPYHSVLFDETQGQLMTKEQRSTPKDIALYLLYLLAKIDHKPNDIYEQQIDRVLHQIDLWQQEHSAMKGFLPTLSLKASEHLQSDSKTLCLSDNAWLSWALSACLAEGPSERHELVRAILKRQDYSEFWDQDRQMFIRSWNLDDAHKKPFSSSINMWTDDGLGPLWMLLHHHIPKKQQSKAEQVLKFYHAMYGSKQGDHYDVPLRTYGSIDELLSWHLLLPWVGDLLPVSIQNDLLMQADFARYHRLSGFLGHSFNRDGVWQAGGVPDAAIQSDVLYAQQGDVSLAATWFPLRNSDDEAKLWAIQSFEQEGLRGRKLFLDLCALAMPILTQSSQWVRSYLEKNSLWTSYQSVLLQLEQSAMAQKPGHRIYKAKDPFKAPGPQKRIDTDLVLSATENVDLLAHWRGIRLLRDLDEGEHFEIQKKQDMYEWVYQLKKPITMEIDLDYAGLDLEQFDQFQMDYEWIGQDNMNIHIDLMNLDMVINRAHSYSFSEGTLLWEKSHWLRGQWPIQPLSLYQGKGVSRMRITLSSDLEHNSSLRKGRLALQQLHLLLKQEQDLKMPDRVQRVPVLDSSFLAEGRLRPLDVFSQGQADRHATDLHGFATMIVFESLASSVDDFARVRVPVDMNFDPEEDMLKRNLLYFKVRKGLIGDMPRYFQMKLRFRTHKGDQELSWNISLEHFEQKVLDKEWVRILLPLDTDDRIVSVQEWVWDTDLALNPNLLGSMLVSPLHMLDEQTCLSDDDKKDTHLYDHRDLMEGDILDHLVIENTRRGLDASLILHEHINEKGGAIGVFYPEQKLKGSKIVFEYAPLHYPDGMFRVKFFYGQNLVLEGDVPVRYSAEDRCSVLHLPHAAIGRIVDRVEFSRVQGDVVIQEIRCEY